MIGSRLHRARGASPLHKARLFFAAQSALGAAWWIAVALSPSMRRWTLGDWRPELVAGPDLVLFVGASAAAAITASRWWALVVVSWTVGITAALGISGLLSRQAGWGVVAMAVSSVGTTGAASTIWFGELPFGRVFFVGPFRFRESRERSGASHLAHGLSQLVVFWTGLLIATPILVAWAERRLRLALPPLESVPEAVGAGLFLAASALGVWSLVAMALRGEGTPLPAATARKLVVAGPYRYVRNPMALAGGLQTIGVGLVLGSWAVLVLAFSGAIAWHTLIRPREEDDLVDRFGGAYVAYRESVRCWLPRRRPVA